MTPEPYHCLNEGKTRLLSVCFQMHLFHAILHAPLLPLALLCTFFLDYILITFKLVNYIQALSEKGIFDVSSFFHPLATSSCELNSLTDWVGLLAWSCNPARYLKVRFRGFYRSHGFLIIKDYHLNLQAYQA